MFCCPRLLGDTGHIHHSRIISFARHKYSVDGLYSAAQQFTAHICSSHKGKLTKRVASVSAILGNMSDFPNSICYNTSLLFSTTSKGPLTHHTLLVSVLSLARDCAIAAVRRPSLCRPAIIDFLLVSWLFLLLFLLVLLQTPNRVCPRKALQV